jgi:hypothetical protein
MENENAELDRLQAAYKVAIDEWIVLIREEEAIASVDHTLAEVDQWENAGFRQAEAGDKAKAAKEEYEGALRQKFFGF